MRMPSLRRAVLAVLLFGAASANADETFDLTKVPAQQYGYPLSSCYVTVTIVDTGSLLNLQGPNGLGLAGSGPDDTALDASEELRIKSNLPTTFISYQVLHAGNENGVAPAGEALLTGLDENEVELAPVSVSGTGLINVSVRESWKSWYIWSSKTITVTGDAIRETIR